MVRHIGSALTDVTYVFDEPTIGLHPHDIERMNNLLLELRDKGNTVLVVEHKPETIVIADHVVDLGPGAGTGGGTICFEGTVEGLKASDTLTGRHLEYRTALKDSVRTPTGSLEIRGANSHNLQDVDVDVPLGVLCVVTGVAGSGKSSLIHGSLIPDRAALDWRRVGRPDRDQGLAPQQPRDVHGAARSHPHRLREGQRGQAGAVQRQLGGRLPDLQRQRDDLHRARLHGHGGDAVRGLRRQAVPGRGAGAAARRAQHRRGARPPRRRGPRLLRRRARPGRPRPRRSWSASRTSGSATSSSASRSRRCPVASGSGSSWPPTWPRRAASTSSTSRPRGLHLADVEHLLGLLDRLVDAGKSVIVIAHHQAVMAHADWIIDLGPGRRPRRRPDRLRGHARRPRRRPVHPHRRAPRGLRRRLTTARTT